MSMSHNIDNTTLNWVKEEIDETLKQARHALEEYVENSDDTTQLQFTYNYIHQVHGTLQMVELHGAALLTDEMEKLAQALMRDTVSDKDRAYEILMRAIIQLPDYLEKIQSGLRDDPLILLPLLNELRGSRGEGDLPENALFAPSIDTSVELPLQRAEGKKDGQALAKKLRHTFQVGLLGWYRNQDPKGSLDKIQVVLNELEKGSRDDSTARIWYIANGLIEALHDDGLEPSVAMNKMLGQVDREVKRMIDEGEDVVKNEPSPDLITNLLYYIARSTSTGPRVSDIKQRFNLESLVNQQQDLDSARQSLGGPNVALLETVSVAIRDYLTQVKDALDIFLRGDRKQTKELAKQSETLQKIADTLGMIGLTNQQQRVLEQDNVLKSITDGEHQADEDVLMEIAHELLGVESSLQRLAREQADDQTKLEGGATRLNKGEFKDIQATLLEEISVNMAKIKDAIVSFIDAPQEHDLLEDLPQLFNEVQGAMKIIDLEYPGNLLNGISQYVKAELVSKHRVPEQEELDALADAMATIEYYLEAVPQNQGNAVSMLKVAHEALERLGYPVAVPAGQDQDGSAGEAAEQAAGMELEGIDDLSLQTVAEVAEQAPEVQQSEESLELTLDDGAEPSIQLQDEDISEFSLTADDFFEQEEGAPADNDAVQPEADSELELTLEADAPIQEDAEVAEPETPEPVEATAPPAGNAAVQPGSLLADVDDDILGIFIEEAREELEVIQEHLPQWIHNQSDEESLSRIRRSFHTLKGSGRLVGAVEIGEFAWSMENMLNRVIDQTIKAHDNMFTLLKEAMEALPHLIDTIENHTVHSVDVDGLSKRAFAIVNNEKEAEHESFAQAHQDEVVHVTPENHDENMASSPLDSLDINLSDPDVDGSSADAADVMDPVLYDIFSKESEAHISNVNEFLTQSEHEQDKLVPTEPLVRALHTLHGSARMAGASNIAEIAGWLEKYTKTAMGNESVLGEDGAGSLRTAVQSVESMLQQINNPEIEVPEVQPLVNRLKALYEVEVELEEQRLHSEVTPIESAPAVEAEESAEVAEYDLELLEVFLEEGAEILDNSEAILERMKTEPTSLEIVGELQRELHTLKGGARMAGVTAIGDLSHSMESLLTDISDEKLVNTPATVGVLHQVVDRLFNMLELAQQRAVIHPVPELIQTIEAIRRGEAAPEFDAAETEEQTAMAAQSAEQAESDVETVAADAVDDAQSDDALAAAEDVDDSAKSMESPADPFDFPVAPPLKKAVREVASVAVKTKDDKPAVAAQDAVRVRAELLDDLVNFAGEVSIYRSRMEQQNTVFTSNLTEMGNTVSRLQEQLRKLEIETEAQILYRYEKEGFSKDDFDPLEMDRYSYVQELSRGLSESINDISSIKSLMDNLIRDSDTLLVQQSRVNTDLQEGLMRTRMVPFSQIASRLRRIARQTCQELKKEAELEIIGEQGEIDRTVLERITAPLEHMLRNSISHGIESPKDRKKAGKPAKGKLVIEILRQGSEVMLQMTDDGAGMNLKAIRKKALEKGLLDRNAEITDHDIMAFILEPGFSTAAEVTQISGRGVGMDVVNSEIKQLGGALEIDSETGKGSKFTIHLPLTMAVNHALLVRVGEEMYAVPLSGIEGIVRLNRDDIANYVNNPKLKYNYADNDYEVRSLNMLLGSLEQSEEEEKVVPVLLIRSGDHRVALQVDNLMGSREIVVKSIGRQLSNVRGISGATILGDGRVVLILDMGALIRMSASVRTQALLHRHEHEMPADEKKITVMVVDDSITVRKVTSRLLERNEMIPVTAKDGVDAVAQLEEFKPDLFLLDIEMPRMDGFELATYIRNDQTLKHIPIIMITSRTGDKHRNRAMDIGVNEYLGKPYQEIDLLNRIKDLLKDSHGYVESGD